MRSMLLLLTAQQGLGLPQQHQPPTQQLQPQAFVPLGVGSITPRGWLLEQLKLQAEGLSGHLAMFYPSIAESWWVGGTDDQGSWIYQQAPYWSVSLSLSLSLSHRPTHPSVHAAPLRDR
eukprot:COSAG03_NODE_199_length_10789_cov_369.743312_16_plen_119_part_00